jgi:hypothetical protein
MNPDHSHHHHHHHHHHRCWLDVYFVEPLQPYLWFWWKYLECEATASYPHTNLKKKKTKLQSVMMCCYCYHQTRKTRKKSRVFSSAINLAWRSLQVIDLLPLQTSDSPVVSHPFPPTRYHCLALCQHRTCHFVPFVLSLQAKRLEHCYHNTKFQLHRSPVFFFCTIFILLYKHRPIYIFLSAWISIYTQTHTYIQIYMFK